MLLAVSDQVFQLVELAVAGNEQTAGCLIGHGDEHAADGELAQIMCVLAGRNGGTQTGMVSQQVQAVGLCIADVLSCDRAAAGDIVDHDVVAGVNFVDTLQEDAGGHIRAAACLGGNIEADGIGGPVAAACRSGGTGCACAAGSSGAGAGAAAGGQAQSSGGNTGGLQEVTTGNVELTHDLVLLLTNVFFLLRSSSFTVLTRHRFF